MHKSRTTLKTTFVAAVRTGAMVVLLTSLVTVFMIVAVVACILLYVCHRRRQARSNQVEVIKVFGFDLDIGDELQEKRKEYDYYFSYAGTHNKMFSQPAELAVSIHEALSHRGLGFMSTSVFQRADCKHDTAVYKYTEKETHSDYISLV